MNTLQRFKEKITEPSNWFVLQMAGVYIGWKILYHFIDTATGPARELWLKIVEQLSRFYAAVSVAILQFMGEEVVQKGKAIYYYNFHSSVNVEEHCLAIPAMFIFTFSILLFKGKVKDKLWFIPLGLFAIAFINIVRLVPLAFVFAHLPEKYFIFHHSFLFVIITYGLILMLVRIWMKYFSDMHTSTLNQ